MWNYQQTAFKLEEKRDLCLFLLLWGRKNNIINVAHPKQLHFIIPGFIFAAKEGFMLIDWKHYLEFVLYFIYLFARKEAQHSLGIYYIDQFYLGFSSAIKQANQVSNIYIHA